MKTMTQPTATVLTELVHDYAVYNQWANETLAAWLKTKPKDALMEPVKSSFSGIRETVLHIWDTERFWLSVIKQEEAPPSFRMTGFNGSLEDVFDGLKKTSSEFTAFVQQLDEEALLEKVSFDTPWAGGTQSRFEFIHHCMNHSTYHRGQITCMGHHVDLHDAPMTDYSFYLLVVKGK